MLEVLERRRAVLRKQRDRLLAKIQNGECGDPLNDYSDQLWETRSRLLVYGDFEITDDPSPEFRAMWKGIETDDPDQLREWISDCGATANRIIATNYDDLSGAENALLTKQGLAVKKELEIVFSLIGCIWTPKIISAWKGEAE